MPDANDVTQIVAGLAQEAGIPGAACTVLHAGAAIDVVTGWANPQAGWVTTTETGFQIGSVTKMVTAMTLMACVERGLLRLEDEVVDLVPGLRHSVDGRIAEIRVQDLLHHRSGFESQYWTDLGRGQSARRLTVTAVADVPLIHAPGEIFSYTNNGYVLAGYLVERLLGRDWEDAVEDLVCAPLALETLSVLPERALLGPVALGQLRDPVSPAGYRPARRWATARGLASGGGITVSAHDLARTVRAYAGLSHGAAGRPLSTETTTLMQETLTEVPGWKYEAWGLGHAVFPTVDGRTMLGHDGQSPSQAAAVRVVPDEDLVVTVCSNAAWGSAFASRAAEALVAEFTGIRRTPPPAPDGSIAGVGPQYSGVFRRLNSLHSAQRVGDRLVMTETGTMSDQFGFFGITDAPSPTCTEYRPVHEGSFVADDGSELHFLRPDAGGAPTWIHDGFRIATRASPAR
ncbi:serine hydrolase domain-containing protein [Microbacterium capsulatum]|uniref:Serine hydrolase domain-containing protein n=1 Tax=Microbacterium capsulatum TaxID=3041921 RepID=A0ABU0XBV4_9MICO|nr:serine hydrolase domain-containing protein [Microbacterium sp. ASV81]MDQ4212548.1 serine hydrolase domain-containing protein [Microbacterium sp. ASV81]